MARVRQARRCGAARQDGEPCGAWAMTGGFVCRVHGGTAPRVLYAARVRQFETDALRAFEHDYARWTREWTAWQVRRIAITSELLGIPPDEVRPVDIGCCRGLYGRPDGPETEPKVRRDRRFGSRAG